MGGERMTVRPGSGFDTQTRWKIDEEKRKKELDKTVKEIKKTMDAIVKACEEKGFADATSLQVGMKKEEALCVRGWQFPDKTNTQITAGGVTEQVIYRRSSSETDYLYFENGILRTIQEH